MEDIPAFLLIRRTHDDIPYDYCLDTTDGSISGDDEDDENAYDSYHDRYCYDVCTVYVNGQEMTCDEDDMDEFKWIESVQRYVHIDEVSYCEECDSWYLTEDAVKSGITGEPYCCNECLKAAELEYAKDNWTFSEYDQKFLKQWITENVPGARIETDNTGNLYITKGESQTFPCVVSHLDQVQRTHSSDFRALEASNIIIGYSSKNHRQEGLGADDKNGIWVCLKCLQKYEAIKAVFFVQEETGCQGKRNHEKDIQIRGPLHNH